MRAPLSILDNLVVQLDVAVKSINGGSNVRTRPSPANKLKKSALSSQDIERAIRVMRVNHSGEVCAQALYQGQALAARSPEIEQTMTHAANEEIDHLAWCEERINHLHGQTSYLNPLWYAASFTTGVVAGLAGDKFNLGFLAATEDLVCEHLDNYMDKLPESDKESKAVLSQMKLDEKEHATAAREAGGIEFPKPVKHLMRLVSRTMTMSTYRV